MTMNLPHALPSATMLTAVLAANLAVAEPFSLDPSHTALTFEIDHLGFSASTGAFRDVSADLNIDVANPDQSAATFVINAASIDTNWPERDAHLRSADFFHVDAYETITYTVTGIDMTSETQARVTGDLTMLGVTRPGDFTATLNSRGAHPFHDHNVIGFTTHGEIQRSDWGMTAFLPAVGETVKLTLNFEATPAG